MDVLSRVNEVFREVFDDEELTVARETTAGDVSGWDSLMHVRLVLALEKAFGVRFSSSEVASLADVGELVDVLDRKVTSLGIEEIMGNHALFKEVSSLARASQPDKALQLLGDAIRRGQLSAEEIDKAGGRCKALFDQSGAKPTCRVLLLGQSTTTWLASALTATAWGDGRVIEVVEGAYDNVMQELLAARTDGPRIDVVVLLPWNQRLLSNAAGSALSDRISGECSFWKQAWGLVESRLGARVIQVGYDWMTAGPLGYGLASKGEGDVALLRAVNQELRDALPPGGCFIDLEQVSGDLGRSRFYDPRRYYWTKQPFSEEGIVRLAAAPVPPALAP